MAHSSPFRRLVLVGVAAALAGCASTPSAPYVNAQIAGDYAEFYTKAPTDSAAAMAAIVRAEKADPENAYTQYLRASALAQSGDFAAASRLLDKANAMPKIVHYVAAPPPSDPMQTLNRIRQLGYTVDRADLPEKERLAYLAAVRQVGKRVAQCEPVASLAVVTGSSVIRRGYQAEVAYWKRKGDAEKAAAAQKGLNTFLKWEDDLTKQLAETVADLTRGAGKAAGLTEAELADYAKGKPLQDAEKQRRADEAREKMYAQEVETLRRLLKTMPQVGLR